MKLADKLQKLQNRAARTLTFSNYDTDASHDLTLELNIIESLFE